MAEQIQKLQKVSNLNISGLSSNQIVNLGMKLKPEELQSYIDKIKEVKSASNGVFNEEAARNYANAISGLESKQAALLLSTQRLSNAQIAETLAINESNVAKNYQAMVDAGLLVRKQKLTVAEIQENLQTILGTEADVSATMTSLGLSAAIEGQEHQTVQLTSKKLRELVVTRALTEAQAQELAMRTGVAIATKTQTASTLPKWTASLKASTLAIWGQVKATAAWLATNPVGWCIMAVTAIFSVTKAIKKYRENILKAAEDSKQAINEVTDNYKNLSSSVSDIKQRYAELAQGINQTTGENKSLSNDEYAEFLDLSNQLSELFPSLTKRYDENGNAILNLSGNVDTIISSLNNLLAAEKELANQKILEELPNVLKGYNMEYPDLREEKTQLEAWKHDLEVAYESFQDTNKVYRTDFGSDNNTGYVELTNVLSQLGIGSRTIEDQYSPGYGTIEVKNYDDTIEKIRIALKEASMDFSKLDSEIKSTNAEFNKYLNTWLSDNWNYLSIKDSKLQNIVQDMLFNSDWMAEATLQGINTNDWDTLSKWINEYYIDPISNIDDNSVKEALLDLYSLPDGDESIKDYTEKIQRATEAVQNYCNENNVTIPINIDDKTSSINVLTENVKEKLQDEFDDKVGELTFEELQIAAEQIEVEDGVLLSWDELIAKIKETKEATSAIQPPSLSDTITQLNTQLKPAFDSLQSAYNGIFTSDGFTIQNVDLSMLDSMESKLDDLNAIDGISIDYSSFENLARVLTDTSSTTDDVKTAFNLLATDIVAGLNPALSDCSGENYRLVQSLLESAGITNAEAVMVSSLGYTYEDYAAAKRECAAAGFDLTDKAEQEIEKFTMQQIAAENCGQALALLQLKKALCRETALTPGSDINRLYQLAKAAGIATEQIGMLAGLNAAYEKESAAGHTQAALAIAGRMAEVKADVEKQFAEIGNVEVDFSAKVNKGTSSAAAKQEETDYKNLLDAETNLLEQQLAANIITFQEYTDRQKQIIDDYYRDGKIKAQDYYDALADMYAGQLSHRDKAIRAVEGTIDREISRLNEQKEAIENSYQVKIDAIQSEIDALNKANDARKTQIDLEKAQYEAERARNQRVNKVFDGSQFVYSADEDAIRDAEDNLADRKLQSDISLLEGQITSLKTEMENATKSLDLQIGALEAYKGRWNEISGVYEEQQNRLIAAEILGADWETQILDGRLGVLQSFTEQYIALQQAQADAAVNAARIKAEADAGNPAGGNVGGAPGTQTLGGTETSSPPPGTNGKKKLGTGGPHYDLKMQKFHDGLDEGYAGNAPSGSQNLKILQSAAQKLHLNADEVPAVLKTGELVLTPEQQQNIVNNARMAFLRDNHMAIGAISSQIGLQAHTIPNTVNIDSITISCPNVTNNTGAEYILKSLQRLPLDTLQYTHRRQ